MTTPPFTIQQASTLSGISVHTLRYYERIGLLQPVPRAANGHRRYSADDVRRIELLKRLRQTGMPIEDIQRYAQLLNESVPNPAERRQMLEAHRQRLLKDIDDLHAMVAFIDAKVQTYFEQEARQQVAQP